MAGDPYKHVSGGEEFSASAKTWNAMLDAARAHRQRSFNASDAREVSGEPRRLKILVKNTTGSDITATFPILQMDGPVYNVDDRATVIFNEVVIKGKVPLSSASIGDIVIVQGPIGAGRVAEAVLWGPAWCDVDVTDIDHTHAAPDTSTTQLTSDTEGAPILWKGEGTGVSKVLILMQPTLALGFDRCQGFATTSFTEAASTITVDNVKATRGASPLDDPEDTAETMVVQNDFGWAGDNNALVYFEYHANTNTWHAYQVECPEPEE